jgi:hypothetical protein
LILDTTVQLGCAGSVGGVTYYYSCCWNGYSANVYNPNTFQPSLQYRMCYDFPSLGLTLCSKPYTLNAGQQASIIPEVYIPRIPRGTYSGSAYDQYWDGSKWVTESTANALLYISAGCITQLTVSVVAQPC